MAENLRKHAIQASWKQRSPESLTIFRASRWI
jgi:hypothetical protein